MPRSMHALSLPGRCVTFNLYVLYFNDRISIYLCVFMKMELSQGTTHKVKSSPSLQASV